MVLCGRWTTARRSPSLLQPVTRFEDCSNYGANGNASAFANPAWDLLFPLLTLGWVVLIVMEQVLPVTWRGRTRLDGWLRATVAVSVSIVGSCSLVSSFLVLCR